MKKRTHVLFLFLLCVLLLIPSCEGKSAYELAVEQGFRGSVDEWLESLKGEAGEKGEAGIDGSQGRPGADGRDITEAYVNEDGVLVIRYSDGAVEEIGSVKGADGEIVWSDIGEDNRRFKVIAGVIRNTGAGWTYIDDVGHTPMNLVSISVNSTDKTLTVNYGFTAKKVITFSVTPDETFARQYTVGASVGFSHATLKMYSQPKTVGGYVFYDGKDWRIEKSGFTKAAFDEETGDLYLYHEDLSFLSAKDLFLCSADGREAECRMATVGTNFLCVRFYDENGQLIKTPQTCMRAYVTRQLNATQVDPNTVISGTGNFWIMGIMEIK